MTNRFTFTHSAPNIFKNEINQLDPKNASIENDLPTKVLIGSSDIER